MRTASEAPSENVAKLRVRSPGPPLRGAAALGNRRQVAPRKVARLPLLALGQLVEPEDAGPEVGALQRLDVQTYLPGDLLVKADVASMAHSLELRSPLLYRRVLELGISLPDRLKLSGRRGKAALRKAFCAQLPPEVAERGKTGFGVPLSGWFRRELRPLAAELLLDSTARGRGQLRVPTVKRLLDEHVSGRADHGHRLWCLVMLELWQRTWVDAAQPVAPAAAVS